MKGLHHATTRRTRPPRPCRAAAAPPLLLAALVLFALGGCGVKARPRLPDVPPPAAVQDLRGQIQDDHIVLQWSVARPKPNDRPPPAGFYVYQAATAANETPCDGCPLPFVKVGQVAVQTPIEADVELTYDTPAQADMHYVFKVVAYDRRGNAGEDSNLLRVPAAATP